MVGNRIGTDITGSIDLGNAIYGIDTGLGANVIGEVGAGNLISGNDSAGAIIRGSGNVVRAANQIGTNAAGLAAITNGIGVGLFDADAAVIGGTAPGDGNQISGNGFGLGLVFSTGATQPAVVQGNLFGTAPNGVDPVANINASIYGAGTARAVVGGILPGQANVIAFGNFGAWIEGSAAITVRGNSMFGVGFRLIDLGPDGVTLNNPLDADVGPNQFQNYPGVSGVTTTSVGGRDLHGAERQLHHRLLLEPGWHGGSNVDRQRGGHDRRRGVCGDPGAGGGPDQRSVRHGHRDGLGGQHLGVRACRRGAVAEGWTRRSTGAQRSSVRVSRRDASATRPPVSSPPSLRATKVRNESIAPGLSSPARARPW